MNEGGGGPHDRDSQKAPDEKQLNNLMAWLKSLNIAIHPSEGATHLVLGLVGDTSVVDIDLLRALDIVEDVKRVQEPYKNANRKFHPRGHASSTVARTRRIGGGAFPVIAGPCSRGKRGADHAWSPRRSRRAGATMLRGGAFKPRTSPYAFQGLRGRRAGAAAARPSSVTGLPIVTEIMDLAQLAAV